MLAVAAFAAALLSFAAVPAATILASARGEGTRRHGPAWLRFALAVRPTLLFLTLGLTGLAALRQPGWGELALLAGAALFVALARALQPDTLFEAIHDPPAQALADAPVAAGATVLGLERGGAARAYLVETLARHAVVNDHLNGEPVLVAWSPLDESGAAFDPRVEEEGLGFRVAGFARRDLLLQDERGTIWRRSGGEARALAGPLAGRSLAAIPVEATTWEAWRAAHPGTTLVVAPPARSRRDLSRLFPRAWILRRLAGTSRHGR